MEAHFLSFSLIFKVGKIFSIVLSLKNSSGCDPELIFFFFGWKSAEDWVIQIHIRFVLHNIELYIMTMEPRL